VRVIAPTKTEGTFSASHPKPVEFSLEPGEVVYILDYYYGGDARVWCRGRLIEIFDVTWVTFLDGAGCASSPSCTGKEEIAIESTWWVRVRNRRGSIGWLKNPAGRFAGSSCLD
jgi:hypothetical protein